MCRDSDTDSLSTAMLVPHRDFFKISEAWLDKLPPPTKPRCSASNDPRLKLQLWSALPFELWVHKNTTIARKRETVGSLVGG